MTFAKILSALFLCLTISCAQDDYHPDPPANNDNSGAADDDAPITQADLVGNWSKPCEAAGTAGFRKDALTFDATTVQLQTQVHQGDSSCEGTADLEARANFNYTVPSFDPAANNQIDLVLNHIRAKINSALAVAAANTQNFCGFSDWAIGVEKDVTGRDCIEELPGAGGRFFQIFKFETRDRLFVGQVDSAHDGDTAAERPTALEATPYTRAR